MANPEHVKIVRRGKDAVDEWRRKNPRARLDLSSTNFASADLQEFDLRGADLTSAKLNHANLVFANLRTAKLLLADLSKADLFSADLSRAFLGGANLVKAEISFVNMVGCNAVKADFGGACIRSSNISQATLRESDLFFADLSFTDLRKSSLVGANLTQASFIQSELEETNFQLAVFDNTIIADCDLRKSKGLDKIVHKGPSSIGLDTILRSKGLFPDGFLKSIGVPPEVVEFVLTLYNRPIDFYTCFLSHSHKDSEFCIKLLQDLKRSGVRCWYFPEDATMKESLIGEIDRSIKRFDKLVVVCSKHSLQSPAVLREIERGFQREDTEGKQVVFPIRIDDYVRREWEHPRKADIIAKVILDFLNWKDYGYYKKNFDRLLKSLNKSS